MATALEEFKAVSGDPPAAISYQRLSPEIQITSKIWSTSAPQNTQGTERCISYIIRELKQRRRGRQRERQKSNRFDYQKNNFSRASRVFCTFLCCRCPTTT